MFERFLLLMFLPILSEFGLVRQFDSGAVTVARRLFPSTMSFLFRRSVAADSRFIFQTPTANSPRLLLSISSPIPSSGKRTFQLLRRKTFPAKRTRRFLDFQESLRVRDGLPRGAELVYLLPTYRSILLQGMDRISVVGCIVNGAFATGYALLRLFHYFFGDESVENTDIDVNGNNGNDDDATYHYRLDEQGVRWKTKRVEWTFNLHQLVTSFIKRVQTPNAENTRVVACWTLITFMLLFHFRMNCARTPLRIFYHHPTRHYFAIFPRHWRRLRVSSFPSTHVLLRHGAFRIITAEGSHYTLPNRIVTRHFKDAQHCQVFSKKKF